MPGNHKKDFGAQIGPGRLQKNRNDFDTRDPSRFFRRDFEFHGRSFITIEHFDVLAEINFQRTLVLLPNLHLFNDWIAR